VWAPRDALQGFGRWCGSFRRSVSHDPIDLLQALRRHLRARLSRWRVEPVAAAPGVLVGLAAGVRRRTVAHGTVEGVAAVAADEDCRVAHGAFRSAHQSTRGAVSVYMWPPTPQSTSGVPGDGFG